MRKRCHRCPVTPLPPRGLRPRFTPDRLRTIGLVHLENLDAIARGGASVQTLWDMAEAAFTWARVAEVMQVGLPEIAPQLQLTARVIERYARTGKVVFTGQEYQEAKAGVQVMDQLAAEVDVATAEAAARWSDQQLARLVAQERTP